MLHFRSFGHIMRTRVKTTYPECRLFGHVARVPLLVSALAIMHQITPTGPAYPLC
jgi:hypothetical protein